MLRVAIRISLVLGILLANCLSLGSQPAFEAGELESLQDCESIVGGPSVTMVINEMIGYLAVDYKRSHIDKAQGFTVAVLDKLEADRQGFELISVYFAVLEKSVRFLRNNGTPKQNEILSEDIFVYLVREISIRASRTYEEVLLRDPDGLDRALVSRSVLSLYNIWSDVVLSQSRWLPELDEAEDLLASTSEWKAQSSLELLPVQLANAFTLFDRAMADTRLLFDNFRWPARKKLEEVLKEHKRR